MKKYPLMVGMSFLIASGVMTVPIMSCTRSTPSQRELGRVASPDGNGVAVLTIKEKTGFSLPGPEPPRTEAQWAKPMIEDVMRRYRLLR